jgi:hypothetical protein
LTTYEKREISETRIVERQDMRGSRITQDETGVFKSNFILAIPTILGSGHAKASFRAMTVPS